MALHDETALDGFIERDPGCDFSTTVGANQYIDTDGVTRCQVLARRVAASVERMIDSA